MLEKADSAEPGFFQFSAKSVLLSAKLLPNLPTFTLFYQSLPILSNLLNFSKFQQILPNIYQIFDLRSFVAILNSCYLRVFLLMPNLYPQKFRVEEKIFFPTLNPNFLLDNVQIKALLFGLHLNT